MKLSLSSAAAPGLSLEALDLARKARGLEGVELVIDGSFEADAARCSAACVVALRAEEIDVASAPRLARASAALAVPLSVPARAARRDELSSLASAFASAGARLLLAHGSQLEEPLELIAALGALGAPASLGIAWDVRPGQERLDEASAIVLAAGDRLGLVRLHGGGPEQREQDGLGIGSLLVDLALSGYARPVVLCPSRKELLPRWSDWLASSKSSGCGHAHDVRSSRAIEVDVRDVEPKDRMSLILGAYRSLAIGATLHLTLDHDPSCMYHTLNATEPEGSFAFRTVERGPEVWRAEVSKR